MLVSIQAAAYFLYQNHALVDALWARRDETFTDSDLVLIARGLPEKASAGHVVSQLKELRFVEEALGEQGAWQFAPAFRRWLEHLGQIARLRSSGEVTAKIEFLDTRLQSFDTALSGRDWSLGAEALKEIRETLGLIADDFIQTRRAIASEVAKLKGDHRSLPTLQRYRRINRLWSDHLVPMLDQLDPAGPLEVVCDRMGRILNRAVDENFLPDTRIAERIEREAQALRVTLRQSFRECRAEVEPLHSRLRRDSRWAEGASKLLERVAQVGLAEAVSSDVLPLSRFRFEGQSPNSALISAAASWQVLDQPAPVINFQTPAPSPQTGAVFEIVSAVDALPQAQFPIPDLLPWLDRTYGHLGFESVLLAFSTLVIDPRFIARFDPPHSDVPVAGGLVRCAKVHLSLAPVK